MQFHLDDNVELAVIRLLGPSAVSIKTMRLGALCTVGDDEFVTTESLREAKHSPSPALQTC